MARTHEAYALQYDATATIDSHVSTAVLAHVHQPPRTTADPNQPSSPGFQHAETPAEQHLQTASDPHQQQSPKLLSVAQPWPKVEGAKYGVALAAALGRLLLHGVQALIPIIAKAFNNFRLWIIPDVRKKCLSS